MYPYRNRSRWFMFGRYAHLAKAINERKNGLQDSLLEARVQSLVRWNGLRFSVAVVLSLGLVGTAAAWIAGYVPAFRAATDVLAAISATSSLFAGAFTVAYLLLTRLLGQIEADILTILMLRPTK